MARQWFPGPSAELLATVPLAQDGRVPAPLRSPIGREKERTRLVALLHQAIAGSGSVALIGGEAGIGKTTLAAAVGHEASRRGAVVCIGRCHDLTNAVPYGPWVEALAGLPVGTRQPLGRLLIRPSEDGSPFSGGTPMAVFAQVRGDFAAVARPMAGPSRPLVLVLEDIHWADPTSLDLLRYLATGVGSLPILLLATYRTDEVTRRHPLAAVLSLILREARVDEVELGRLGQAEARALVRGRYDLSARAERQLVSYLDTYAEGVPFYMVELLRALEDERRLAKTDNGWRLDDVATFRVPRRLEGILNGRLARLPDDLREQLALAAVIGEEPGLALWAAVARVSEVALSEVVEAGAEVGLVDPSPDGGTIRFTHALVREALYQSVISPRRRAWHRQIGETLQRISAHDPEIVALHFQRAGDERAIPELIEAGARAQRAYAWRTAAARYEDALALLADEPDKAATRGWLYFHLASMLRFSDPGGSFAYIVEAKTLAAAAGDRALAAMVRCDGGLLQMMAGSMRAGLAEAEAGLNAVDALTDVDRDRLTPTGLPLAWATLPRRGAVALMQAVVGRANEGLALAELVRGASGVGPRAVRPSVPALPEYGDETLADAAFAAAMAHATLGRPLEAQDAFEQARTLYRALGFAASYWWTTANELDWVKIPYFPQQVEARRRLAYEAERVWSQVEDQMKQVEVSSAAGYLYHLYLEGDWVRASEAARQAADSVFTGTRHRGRHVLARILCEQGDVTGAWSTLLDVLPDSGVPPGDVGYLDGLALQRVAATLALRTGDLSTAESWLRAHDRWLEDARAVLGRAEGHLVWAHYHRATGDRERARALAEVALDAAGEPRQPLVQLAAHRLLGELKTATSDVVDAAAHLDVAQAVAEACAAPYERALTLLARAELLTARGDLVQARVLLSEVNTICEPLDTRPALNRAAELAQRCLGLTERELQVLGLLAHGLSNKQIARQLGTKVRTVEQHCRNLYAKIAVHSRAEAALHAARHRLADGGIAPTPPG